MISARFSGAVLAAGAAFWGGPALAEMMISGHRYQCERGVEIAASYITSSEGAAAVINVEGRQIVLLSEPAASGVRYRWPSDGSGYVWWTKGTGATLLWRNGENGEETTLYAECSQV